MLSISLGDSIYVTLMKKNYDEIDHKGYEKKSATKTTAPPPPP